MYSKLKIPSNHVRKEEEVPAVTPVIYWKQPFTDEGKNSSLILGLFQK